MHEFWAELLFTKEFSAKVGRQELIYDNSRMIGNVDWTQQARSFDLALIKYEKAVNRLKLHARFGINTRSESFSKQV